METPADNKPAIQASPHDHDTDPREDTVSLSYAVVSYQTPRYGLDYGTLALANHLWFRPGLEAGAGFRLGFGNRLDGGVCIEGFGSISLVPHFITIMDAVQRTASWRPALGLEFGASTAQFDSPSVAAGSAVLEGTSTRGVYGGVAARPLRFRFTSVHASVLGLTFGTMLGHPGRQLRIQLEVVQVGIFL